MNKTAVVFQVARVLKYIFTLAVLIAIWRTCYWPLAFCVTGLTVANEITALAIRSHRAELDAINGMLLP